MTTYYVDPVGGNDANTGLSFAQRRKTIVGLTAAGDEVRYIRSPAPTSIGNAAWTKGSGAIELAAAKTLDIDMCETAWTASANVTCTTTTTRKQGSVAAQIAVGAAFGTGKVAYKALPATLDLSSFQQVSMWFRRSGTFGNGSFQLKLCSDAVGDVPVDTLTIRPTGTTNAFAQATFTRVTMDNGAALGSGINSIALYVTFDNGADTVILDSIFAAKAPSDPECITLHSLIGKNAGGLEPWCTIASITGTTVTIDHTPASIPTAKYAGTSETVETYVRAVFALDVGSASGVFMPGSGVAANPVSHIGGWDTTSMSVREDVTFYGHNAANGVSFSGASGVYLDYFGFFGVTSVGINHATSGVVGIKGGRLWASGCSTGLIYSPASTTLSNDGGVTFETVIAAFNGTGVSMQEEFTRISTIVADGCATAVTAAAPYATVDDLYARQCVTQGVNITGAGMIIGNLYLEGSNLTNALVVNAAGLQITHIPDMTGALINYSAGAKTSWIGKITKADASNTSINYSAASTVGGGNIIGVFDATAGGNLTVATSPTLSIGQGNGILYFIGDGTITVTAITDTPTRRYTGPTFFYRRASDGSAKSHFGNTTVASQSSNRHTASGVAWRVMPADEASAGEVIMPLARLAVRADVLTTFRLFVYRESANVRAKLRVRANQLPGITADVEDEATLTAAWEELSVSFTPTVDGIVDVEIVGAGDGADSFDYDDAAVTVPA